MPRFARNVHWQIKRQQQQWQERHGFVSVGQIKQTETLTFRELWVSPSESRHEVVNACAARITACSPCLNSASVRSARPRTYPTGSAPRAATTRDARFLR